MFEHWEHNGDGSSFQSRKSDGLNCWGRLGIIISLGIILIVEGFDVTDCQFGGFYKSKWNILGKVKSFSAGED